jgi:DNA invertase Pin-like site-specific DNA recombinase/chorismate mutase
VSGFNKNNISRGAMSQFLSAVHEGKIPPGSYLLVENLDRLTRADIQTALNLLLHIVQSGIICVTLQDSKEWTKESLANLGDLVVSLAMLHRGHDESRVKSERIKAVHNRAREMKDRSVFGRAPGWLKRSQNGKTWEPIPELVAIVKQVFELVAAGYGGVAIAKRANSEGWPLPSLTGRERNSGWHVTFPTKLVRNRAVLGELEFSVFRDGRAVSTGESVDDWYPRIIDDELFFRANAAIDVRRVKPNRRDTSYRNIFQGVMYCGHCGATLTRKIKNGSKNSPNYALYVCSDRHRGLSNCPNYNSKELEVALIPLLYKYFAEYFADDARLTSLRDEISGLEGKILDLKKSRDRLVDAIEQSEVEILPIVRRLEDYEGKLLSYEHQLTQLKAQLMEASLSYEQDDDDAALIKSLYNDDVASEKLRANAHMKMLLYVEAIWIWPREMTAVQLKGQSAPMVLPLPNPKIKPEVRNTEEGEVLVFPMSQRLLDALLGNVSVPLRRKMKQAFE